MKKALLAALCFILVSLTLVNGTFALPEFDEVFQVISGWLEDGIPKIGGEGTAVHVKLVSDDETQSLFPGGEVSRDFHVQNLGTGDVYFRLVYAVQYDSESWENLTISFEKGDGFEESDWMDTSSSGRPYKMKVFTYTKALPIETNSPEVSISIAMGTSVTSEQLSSYGSDFLQAQVLAIGAGDFTADKIIVPSNKTLAEAALDLALPLNSLKPF